jgi:putative sigma-54 modulation protein
MISGHHLDVTDSLRSFITTKMDRLERHSGNIRNIHFILNVEKLQQKAEATVRIKGVQLYAVTSSSGMPPLMLLSTNLIGNSSNTRKK